MGHPWPLAPREDGTGTEPTDLQRIVGAQYATQGLLPSGGGRVSGTSSMAFDVEAGAAFMWASGGSRLGILVPFEATTVQTDPAPATGSRTDTVYVDRDGGVRVAIGSAEAQGGVAIARWEVPAGITATTAAAQSIDRDYAISTGASLGRLASWNAPAGPGSTASGRTYTYGTSFAVPSDRIVRVDLTATLQSTSGNTGHVGFGVVIDGEFVRALSCYYAGWWRTYSGTWTTELPEGVHDIRVWSQLNEGDGWRTEAGQSTTQMNLWDAGVAQ